MLGSKLFDIPSYLSSLFAGGFSYVTHLTMDVTSISLNYTTNHTYDQTESKQIQTQV